MASPDRHTRAFLPRFLTALFRLPQRNLAVRLSLILGVAALGAALLQSFLAGAVASRQVERDVGVRLSDLNAHVVQLLDRGMFERYRDMQILATLAPLRDPLAPPAERRALLETLQRTYPDYAWIGIADPNGTVLASTGQLLEGVSVAERPWFQGAKEQPFVGDVHEARLLAELLPSPDGEPLRFVDVAVPLRNANGQLVGVLGAHLSWAWARDVRASVITPHETDSQIEAVVVRTSGEVLLGPPDVQAQTLALASVTAAQRGQAGVITETWPDGRTYLVSYQQSAGYRDYPGLGWIVLVRQPLAEAFAPALALQRHLVIGLLSLAGLLITLAVLLISRVTRPLRRIAYAADQLRTGKREGALPVIPGDDEVARLAGSLHELVASLLQQEQHLAAANARLEHELEARTFAELEARRQAARANTLAHIAARLNARLELPAVLQAVCEETISALGTDAAVVRLYNSDTDQLELAAVLGMPDAYPAHVPTVPRSLYASVLNHPDVVFTVDDIRASAHPYHNEVREWNMWSSLTVPLRRGDQLLGVLNSLTVEAPATITDDTRTLLRSIADHATQAIGNAWSYDQAQRRLAHIQALRAIDTAITSSHDLPAILMTCVRQVTQQLGVDAALVLRYDAANQWLIWGAGEGLRAPMGALRAGPVAHTIAQRVIHERRRLSHADVSASRRDPRFARWLTQEGFVVYYGVPLIANGAVQGVLEVLHRSSLAPDQEWFEFLDTLAGQVAIAMAHVGLFANLSEANDALVHAYDTTIAGWSRALDLRDKETEGHSQRVTALTLDLALALGIPDTSLVHIRRGALLHDIGKMAIPDQILLKPGPLDSAEWEVMRQHPVYAYELLVPIPYLRPALDIPYGHHEKWDGSGYPQGLKGEQIPLAARLFAVVDVWDALTSDRPYRSAWTPERALAFIKAEAGAHFDPIVVDTFVQLMRAHGIGVDQVDPFDTLA